MLRANAFRPQGEGRAADESNRMRLCRWVLRGTRSIEKLPCEAEGGGREEGGGGRREEGGGRRREGGGREEEGGGGGRRRKEEGGGGRKEEVSDRLYFLLAQPADELTIRVI